MKTWIVPAAIVGGIALGATALAVTVSSGGSTSAPLASAGPLQSTPTSDVTTSTSTGPTRTITVSGLGVVKGRPDVVTINIGVRTQDRTANGALGQANEKATALIATLKNAGVQPDDITTTDVSVYPQFDSGGHFVTGYTASDQVVARLKDLTKAGAVIDAAAAAAGDAITLGGISFSIDDTSGLKQQARTAAVLAAKAQADQLAAAAGAKVGKVLTINETASSSPTPQYYATPSAGAADRAAVPIQPGTQQLTMDVTVVYQLTD